MPHSQLPRLEKRGKRIFSILTWKSSFLIPDVLRTVLSVFNGKRNTTYTCATKPFDYYVM